MHEITSNPDLLSQEMAILSNYNATEQKGFYHIITLSFVILIIFLSAMALQLTLFTDTAIRQTLSKTDIQNWSLLSYIPLLTLYKTASLLLDRHLEWAPKVCILKKVHCIGKKFDDGQTATKFNTNTKYKWTSHGDVPLSGGIF